MADGTSIFAGSSRFSSDLQAVIDRAVAIASLPLRQMQNSRTDLLGKQTAIGSLTSKFSSLRSALTSLDVGGTSAPTATLSDSKVATVHTASGALTANLSLQVITPGSSSTMISGDSAPKVTNPSTQSITTNETVSILINGVPLEVTPPVGSLNALAQAINQASGGVEASVINIGPTGSPDYRLALRSTTLGNVTLGMVDDIQNLTGATTTGTTAQYRVNGVPSSPIESTSRTVTLSPGVTADLLTAGTTDIAIENDGTAFKDALTSFATAYNALVDELDTHRGEGIGALVGDSLPISLASSMRQVLQYTAGGTGINNINGLGLNTDKSGHLIFDTTSFDAAYAENAQAVRSFLGSETGSGFLKAADGVLDQVDGLTSGMLVQAKSQVATSITTTDRSITDQQARITLMESNLRQRLVAADATIALLEQQVSLIKGMFNYDSNNDN